MNDYEKLREVLTPIPEPIYYIHPGRLTIEDQSIIMDIFNDIPSINKAKLTTYIEPGVYEIESICDNCGDRMIIKAKSKSDLMICLKNSGKPYGYSDLCDECIKAKREKDRQERENKEKTKQYTYLTEFLMNPSAKYKQKFTAEFTETEACRIRDCLKTLGGKIFNEEAEDLTQTDYYKTPYLIFMTWLVKYYKDFTCDECNTFTPSKDLKVIFNDNYRGVELIEANWDLAVCLKCKNCISKDS